jgi:RHS repeat-associated protein
MFHIAIDADLPGYPPFEFKRQYSTTYTERGPMGWGWRHNWQVSLRLEDGRYRILDGMDGERVHNVAECDGEKGPRVEVNRDAGVVTFHYYDGRRLVFGSGPDTNGEFLLYERTDGYGNWTRLTYREGLLAKATDSNEREVLFEYAAGLLSVLRVRHRDGSLTVRYQYDTAGRLIRIIDALGHTQAFEYQENLIIRHVDETGLSRYFCYDAQRRCVLNWYEEGMRIRRLEYTPDGRRAVLLDSLGYREVYQLNDHGKVEKTVDPLGRETQWVYDDNGGVICTILPDGTSLMASVFDPEKRVRTTTDARGGQTRFHFDEHDNVVAIENAAGHRIEFEHNSQGDTEAILAPENSHWRIEYDQRGSLCRFTNPKGEWLARSENGAEVRAWDAHGELGRFRFDGEGNLIAHTDPLGRTTRFEYAGQDLLTRMIRPDDSEIHWEYDPRGRILSVTDGLGSTTRYEYSPFGTQIKIVYPDGRTIGMSVDREENTPEIFNGKGEVTRLEFDPAFRTTKITFFDGRSDRHEYDLNDRVILYEDARGRITHFDYDQAGNLIEARLPDGAIVRYAFDEIERLVEITLEPPMGTDVPAKHALFEYNANNYVTAEIHDGYEVHYDYDSAGNVVGIRDSIGRNIRYEIGRWGLITRIEDDGRVYELEYSPAGELLLIRLPGGMTQRFRFDACSRMERREVLSREGRLLAWRNFKYDAADQLVEMEDWRLGRFLYEYDRAGRLIRVRDGIGKTLEEYRYDIEGNLLSSPDFTSYVLDPGNRLRRSGNVKYTYDAVGNLIAIEDGRDRWEMHYEAYQNQLVQLIRSGRLIAEYDYDLTGRRVRKTLSDDEVLFYHHANRLHTLQSSKRGRWDFLYVPDTFIPLCQTQDDRCYFYSFDQIGTPTELWDVEGNLVATLTARAYGSGRRVQWTTSDEIPLPFHFMGQYVDDESGFHYNRYRYYSPTTARFLTQDPFGLDAGLNLYIYPTNPMNWVDPLGLRGMVLQISCRPSDPPPFDPCEQQALQIKVRQMNRQLKQRPRKKRCTDCRKNKQKEYFEETCGGKVPKGWQVDHIQELQVGGADKCCGNLMAIPARPNVSCGSQIRNQIKDFGGVIVGARIAPPGCDQAKNCKREAVRRGKDRSSCEEPDPIEPC